MFIRSPKVVLIASILVAGSTALPTPHPATAALSLRAGSSDAPKKKRKKRKKSSAKAKKVIDSAMKEKDAAEAMGDAIRYVRSGLGTLGVSMVQLTFYFSFFQRQSRNTSRRRSRLAIY